VIVLTHKLNTIKQIIKHVLFLKTHYPMSNKYFRCKLPSFSSSNFNDESESFVFKKLPEDGTLLPKYVGAGT